jgi:hypothetical protein
MAYSKHTWSTNDVITTALMNALETGAEEAYLWSEAVIDSDKDMSGNDITNAGIVEATRFDSDFLLIIGELGADPLAFKASTVPIFNEPPVVVLQKTVPVGVVAGSSMYYQFTLSKTYGTGQIIARVTNSRTGVVGGLYAQSDIGQTVFQVYDADILAGDVLTITIFVSSGDTMGSIIDAGFYAVGIAACNPDPALWV